jgi:hypothetical protein
MQQSYLSTTSKNPQEENSSDDEDLPFVTGYGGNSRYSRDTGCKILRYRVQDTEIPGARYPDAGCKDAGCKDAGCKDCVDDYKKRRLYHLARKIIDGRGGGSEKSQNSRRNRGQI